MVLTESLLWIFSQVQRAAEEEMEHSGQAIRDRLAELYRQLQNNEITEAQFDAQEAQLLDELDRIEEASRGEAGVAQQQPQEETELLQPSAAPQSQDEPDVVLVGAGVAESGRSAGGSDGSGPPVDRAGDK